MEPWHREVIELHEFFEGYFLGTLPVNDLARVEDALDRDFTILGPDGSESDRAATLAAIGQGHDHTKSLKITITEARLLSETDELIAARYIENHELSTGSNHRWSTAVFRQDPAGPNGLRWLTVHETWVAGTRE